MKHKVVLERERDLRAHITAAHIECGGGREPPWLFAFFDGAWKHLAW